MVSTLIQPPKMFVLTQNRYWQNIFSSF